MKTVDELANVAAAVGMQLNASGISWAQISIIGMMIHDSANFTVNHEILELLKTREKVV